MENDQITVFRDNNIRTGVSDSRIKDFAGKIAKKEIHSKFSINIIFVDNKYMLELNKKYFEKDYSTDVISFNLSEEDDSGSLARWI